MHRDISKLIKILGVPLCAPDSYRDLRVLCGAAFMKINVICRLIF
jgi:hypothetical protein